MRRSGRARGNEVLDWHFVAYEMTSARNRSHPARRQDASSGRQSSKKLLNLLLKWRQMFVDGLPDDLLIDAEVVVHQNISHSCDLPPRNGWVLLLDRRINRTHSFANDHEVVDHPDLNQSSS